MSPDTRFADGANRKLKLARGIVWPISGLLLSFVGWWIAFPCAEKLLVRSDGVEALHSFSPLIGLASVCLFIFGAFFLFRSQAFSRLRSFGFALAMFLLVGVPSCRYLAAWGNSLRMNGFARAADNMRPLIAAIEEFKTKNGSLPPNLEALVPGYIKEIPSTGLSLYPKVEYWTKLTGGLGGNEWGLIIRASHNPFNFDTFNYLPLHNYPDWYGGMTERVGDWAYVHE